MTDKTTRTQRSKRPVPGRQQTPRPSEIRHNKRVLMQYLGYSEYLVDAVLQDDTTYTVGEAQKAIHDYLTREV